MSKSRKVIVGLVSYVPPAMGWMVYLPRAAALYPWYGPMAYLRECYIPLIGIAVGWLGGFLLRRRWQTKNKDTKEQGTGKPGAG